MRAIIDEGGNWNEFNSKQFWIYYRCPLPVGASRLSLLWSVFLKLFIFSLYNPWTKPSPILQYLPWPCQVRNKLKNRSPRSNPPAGAGNRPKTNANRRTKAVVTQPTTLPSRPNSSSLINSTVEYHASSSCCINCFPQICFFGKKRIICSSHTRRGVPRVRY